MADNVRKLPSSRNSAEQNKKVLETAQRGTANFKELRESVRVMTNGLDILDKVNFPVLDPNFSIGAMKKKIREAATGSGFPQLLRAGVQVAFNQLVEAYTDTTYEKWTHVVNSDKDTELYAPLHGISFLAERGPTNKFVETSIAGLDLKLKNREFGEILSIDQNLMDDDQTGQMQGLVGDLAEWTKLLYEVYCYGKLASISGGCTYGGLNVPVSETKPSNESVYPYVTSSQKFVGGGYNRPASFGAMTQANIQSGINALMAQLNLLGLKMVVKPKMLTVSPQNQFDAKILMHSTLNPTTVGTVNGGTPTGNMGVNPIEAILDVNVSRFVFDNSGVASGLSKAWYIMDSTKPWFILQLRDPGSVIMENPESGDSFNRKVVRHRLDIRANADFIDPRFVWQGNDGSV